MSLGQNNSPKMFLLFVVYQNDHHYKITVVLTGAYIRRVHTDTHTARDVEGDGLHSCCFQVVPAWFLLTHFPSCLPAGSRCGLERSESSHPGNSWQPMEGGTAEERTTVRV